MLKKLYEAGYLDYKKLILTNLRQLSLSANEALVLIKILEQYTQNSGISLEKLQDELLMSRAEIENALSNLMERNFYEIYVNYDNGVGNECVILDGFFNKIQALLNNELENSSDEIFRINQLVSKAMNRILTATEFEILSSLVIKDRYDYNSFDNACRLLKEKKKNITMKAIAQALVSKQEEKPKDNITSSVVKDFFNSIK